MCMTVRASGFFPLLINVTDSWLSIFDVLNQGDVLFLEEKMLVLSLHSIDQKLIPESLEENCS